MQQQLNKRRLTRTESVSLLKILFSDAQITLIGYCFVVGQQSEYSGRKR